MGRFMKKKSLGRRFDMRVGGALLVAVLIAGGSFAVASGQISGSPSNLLAAVFYSWSAKPMVAIYRSSNSPSGTITTGTSRTLAIFDVYSKNVSNWATLQSLTIDISIYGSSGKNLNATNFTVMYQYCIPSGVTYGYGYKGGSCASVPIWVNSASRTASGYRLVLYSGTPIYPQASGQLYVRANLAYNLGGSAGDTSQLRASIVSGTAMGDQCRAYGWIPSSYSYGYSQCVPIQANVLTGSGSSLNVQRSYGYGYCLL